MFQAPQITGGALPQAPAMDSSQWIQTLLAAQLKKLLQPAMAGQSATQTGAGSGALPADLSNQSPLAVGMQGEGSGATQAPSGWQGLSPGRSGALGLASNIAGLVGPPGLGMALGAINGAMGLTAAQQQQAAMNQTTGLNQNMGFGTAMQAATGLGLGGVGSQGLGGYGNQGRTGGMVGLYDFMDPGVQGAARGMAAHQAANFADTGSIADRYDPVEAANATNDFADSLGGPGDEGGTDGSGGGDPGGAGGDRPDSAFKMGGALPQPVKFRTALPRVNGGVRRLAGGGPTMTSDPMTLALAQQTEQPQSTMQQGMPPQGALPQQAPPMPMASPQAAMPAPIPQQGALSSPQVKPDGYIIPADAVSSLGKGSTEAGAKQLQQIGGILIRGNGDGRSDDVQVNSNGVRVRLSNGEVYVPPEMVAKLGGPQALAKMVENIRGRAVKTMAALPGPIR